MSNKSGGKFLFGFKSIRSTMIFYFSIIIVLALMCFLIISFRYTDKTIMNNSKNYTYQMVEQVNEDIDSYINYMENISKITGKNRDVKEFLFNENLSEKERMESRQRIIDQFITITETREDIYNIGIIAENGRYIINDGNAVINEYSDYEQMSWYVDAINANGASVLSSSHVQNIIKNEYNWVVTLACGLMNPYTCRIEAILFVDLNYSIISNMCDNLNLGSRGYVFVLDEQGDIVYHPSQTLIFSGLKDEKIEEILNNNDKSFVIYEKTKGKLYTNCKSRKTGWMVVGVSDVDELMVERDETQITYLLSASILFIVSILIAILFSNEITKSIKVLSSSMKEVQYGRFENAEIEVTEDNEIGTLSKSFNIMTSKIKELMDENVQEQRLKRKSELRALQAQINPHFLYNTLDSIIWMAESGKNKEVVIMTSSLAKLLRQSISNEDEIVTIDHEINYIKSYLTIQKMRYKDKLEFEIDVDREVKYSYIIKLVLQPLVENAIYHGIKYKNEKGLIRVTGEKIGENVVLKVIDNGQGMDKEKLDNIFCKNKNINSKGNGVGVKNVNERLKLYYGAEYGLKYESILGEGTTAIVTIPYMTERGDDNEGV